MCSLLEFRSVSAQQGGLGLPLLRLWAPSLARVCRSPGRARRLVAPFAAVSAPGLDAGPVGQRLITVVSSALGTLAAWSARRAPGGGTD